MMLIVNYRDFERKNIETEKYLQEMKLMVNNGVLHSDVLYLARKML
jgi:hypothetical protein